MDRKSGKALIAALCWLAFSSCMKDKPAAINNTNVPDGGGDVYIVCQGDYGSGDASLYAYDPRTDSVYGDIYKAANNQALGDVFQSMIRIGSNFFLCINNSDKIVIIDANSKKTASVIGLPQPRYILPVSSSKAYVSSFKHNKIYIINTQTYTLTDSIPLPSQSAEEMCLYNNEAVVTSWDTTANHIYMIDCNTDQIVQTIKVAGYAPKAVLQDKEQMLWVLGGDGIADGSKVATWTRLDPSTGDILASYTFPQDADPICAVFNNTNDTLYFIEAYGGTSNSNGIFRMSINAATLPAQPFIASGQNQNYYALGISPVTGYVFVGDPIGFGVTGAVYIYKPDGTLAPGKSTFPVGRGPGGFYFDE